MFVIIMRSLQTKLEGAKSEIQKWRSSVQNESFVPPGADPGLFYSSGALSYSLFPFVIRIYRD